MRQAVVALALLMSLGGLSTLSGCIIRHRGPRAYHRASHPGHPGPHRRCATQCGDWGYRRTCQRRCHAWRNGVCVSYRQSCQRTRYCRRQVTRCR